MKGHQKLCSSHEPCILIFCERNILPILFENGLREGVSGVNGLKYFESDSIRELTHEVVIKFYGLVMTKTLADAESDCDEVSFRKLYLQNQFLLKLGE